MQGELLEIEEGQFILSAKGRALALDDLRALTAGRIKRPLNERERMRFAHVQTMFAIWKDNADSVAELE